MTIWYIYSHVSRSIREKKISERWTSQH